MTVYALTRLFAWLYGIPWPIEADMMSTLFIISLIVSPFELIGLAYVIAKALESRKCLKGGCR